MSYRHEAAGPAGLCSPAALDQHDHGVGRLSEVRSARVGRGFPGWITIPDGKTYLQSRRDLLQISGIDDAVVCRSADRPFPPLTQERDLIFLTALLDRRTAVRGLPLASIAVAALALTACSSGAKSSAGDGLQPPTAPISQSAASSAGRNASPAGSVDVCALLSPGDATAVAKQFALASDPSATYKLITQKQPPPTTAYPSAACQFTIAEVTADNMGNEAIVTVGVQPARYLDKTGTRIAGLGDEAYDEGDYVEVRTGDLVLQSNHHSGASKNFINALYRLMIPNIS
ncbi:MAG: hypothetical protein JWM76_1689 [Pseudonocardiales bacterium]|nr:hypothetical protein [Pseudonocardiales bacterium]